MKIYIKNLAGKISEAMPATITVPMVGLCVEDNGTFAHYIFIRDSGSKRLKRYFIRTLNNERFGSTMYHYFNEKIGFFDSVPNQDLHAMVLPDNSIFMSTEEINVLVAGIKTKKIDSSCAYLEGSLLTRRQQAFLYSGLVTGVQAGMTFCEYMQKNILEEPNAVKILQASISQNSQSFFEKESDDYSELLNFQFAFLAPNNIVRFSDALQTRTKYQATVGDIIDFYTHCIQIQLKKMNADCVSEDNIRRLTDASRAVLRGNLTHDFGDDGIYNSHGLKPWEDAVFRAIMRIIEVQEQDNTITVMTSLLLQDNFKEFHYEIREALVDMIGVIYGKTRTTMTDYITVMDDVCAAYPQTGWNNFLSRLEHAELALLTLIKSRDALSREEIPSAIRKKIQAALLDNNKLDGEAAYAEILILLHRVSLLSARHIKKVFLYPEKNISCLCCILRFLLQAGCLTAENFIAATSLDWQPKEFLSILSLLKLKGILNNKNFSMLLDKESNFYLIFDILSLLHRNESLDQICFEGVLSSNSFDGLFGALELLDDANFELEDIAPLALSCIDHKTLDKALYLLDSEHSLSEENFITVVSSEILEELFEGMHFLSHHECFNDKNFNAIQESENPLGSAKLLKVLLEYREERELRSEFTSIFYSSDDHRAARFLCAYEAYVHSGDLGDLDPVVDEEPDRFLAKALRENGLLRRDRLLNCARLAPEVSPAESPLAIGSS